MSFDHPLAPRHNGSDDAQELLLQGYGKVTAARKLDGSLVTETDHSADQFITTQLAVAFPAHAILSEERNTEYDPFADFTWVIDPLDGTTNLARELPIWGVSVALLYRGLPLLGLLNSLLLHEIYCVRGEWQCPRRHRGYAKVMGLSRGPFDFERGWWKLSEVR
jgi:fructose-1,6-bisphosphatase/inositol monophosphatase family enzyme